jgi:hypothetical protein
MMVVADYIQESKEAYFVALRRREDVEKSNVWLEG